MRGKEMKEVRRGKKKRDFSLNKGQVLIEFTFCMIIVFLMIYAIMKIVQWTGLDMVNRRAAHDEVLTSTIVEDYGGCVTPCVWPMVGCCDADPTDITDGPMRQIDPYFYRPMKMNAVWDGS